MAWAPGVHAQFLRLGPFDITPSASLEFIWTDNVDGVRESESEESGLRRDDYYMTFGLGFDIDADMSEEWTVGSGIDFQIERHLYRDDLDTKDLSDIFGEVFFNNEIKTGYYTLTLEAGYEHVREVDDDETFKSGSLKTRDPHSIISLGAGLSWDRRQVGVGLGYTFTRERHDDEEFQDADEDTQAIDFNVTYEVNNRVTLRYDYTREKTDLVNVEDDPSSGVWDWTQFAGVDLDLIEDDPKLTYTFGMEKEKNAGVESDWDFVHALTLSDDWQISENLELSGQAQYQYEDNPEVDDVAFQYSVSLDHSISRTARHSITLTREPKDTFGSTTDTDSTTYEYDFTKEDFFLRDCTLELGVSYDINEPLGPDDGVTEKSWRYDVGIDWTRPVTTKISRTLAYDYYLEDLNTEEEDLDEHRVTLSFEYSY